MRKEGGKGTYEAVHGFLDLDVDGTACLFARCDGRVDEAGVAGFAGRCEDEGRVRRCVLFVTNASIVKEKN